MLMAFAHRSSPAGCGLEAPRYELYTLDRYFKDAPEGYRLKAGGSVLIEDNKAKLLNRLRRLEGQVRGVARMVEEDRYCIDILTQIQAVRAALTRVETELLRDHVDHCIRGAFTSGDEDDQRRKIEELVEVLQRTAR